MDRGRRKAVKKLQDVGGKGAGDPQQQPTAQAVSIETAVPDSNPAPGKTNSRPGGKAKRKTNRCEIEPEKSPVNTYLYSSDDDQLQGMEQPAATASAELGKQYEWLQHVGPSSICTEEYRDGEKRHLQRPGATRAGRHGDELRFKPRATSARGHESRQERWAKKKHPRATSAGEHESRLERLWEEHLHSVRLQKMDKSRTHTGVSPSEHGQKRLLDISSSSEEGVQGLPDSDSEQESEPRSHMEDEGTQLLDMVGTYFQQEETGKDLEARMAASIDYMTTHHLKTDTLAEVWARHLPPRNCAALNVPKVNRSIWRHVGQDIRSLDIKIQNASKGLSAGITALARTLENVDMSNDMKDALALFCNVQFELNNIRKGAIQPALDPKFAILCKQKAIKPQNLLFGGDLSKQVKDLEEEAKTLGLIKATKGYVGKRYHPYGTTKKASTSMYSTKNWREARGNQQQRPFLGVGPGRPQWKMRKPPLQHLPHFQPQGPPQPRLRPRK
ncbi:uncharacterized protein LOC129707038 [Leucoraja erinacea]|uniref:uncharacterized protein LOC129707038 n=1 Tax=Leucoraja erinaceus TaxID=7782 RepID=UPI0024537745|nr:uncharacterized protein LOC129707038 [Leucoraja erinacea]